MIDLNKTYVTRNERPVVLFAILLSEENPYSVVGAYLDNYSEWTGETWTIEGYVYDDEEPMDRDLKEFSDELPVLPEGIKLSGVYK
jgi:hypothetical protein